MTAELLMEVIHLQVLNKYHERLTDRSVWLEPKPLMLPALQAKYGM